MVVQMCIMFSFSYIFPIDVDVDECMMGLDNCDENARCDNTDSGFTCTCLDGFVGDGVMCTGRLCVFALLTVLAWPCLGYFFLCLAV